MNRNHQNGVALVITLIMLSVVTFMAITFLALSRRERNAVAVTSSQTTATLMSDTALARAQGELVSRLMERMALAVSNQVLVPIPASNLLSAELMVSTNLIDRAGFDASLESDPRRALANINYDYDKSGQRLTPPLAQMNIGRLQYDARPPVYIPTNSAGALEFRYYVDFNRNGRYDSNGWQAILDNRGLPIQSTNNYQYVVGDPEWIGVLERPTQRHSASNLFVGRYAYLVLPSGKSLDINFLHNHAKNTLALTSDGFVRNQGVGTWEMNLAGFLRDLNTNQWGGAQPDVYYQYRTNLTQPSLGQSFIDANGLLRHVGNKVSLANTNQFGTNSAPLSLLNIDLFGSGTHMGSVFALPPYQNRNKLNLPWPGSDTTNLFYDVQELLDTNKTSLGFVQRLQGNYYTGTRNSSYDRNTFYRLLGQLGVDSEPGVAGKMNLNYPTDAQGVVTNLAARWTPLAFFTNAAARLLSTQPELGLGYTNFGVTSIPIYPVNYYTPAVHRWLQLAANMYDATTNRLQLSTVNPYLPSVFRPIFCRTNNVVVISGYIEETNIAFLNYSWLDLSDPIQRAQIPNNSRNVTNKLIYGVPLVIGAKKGFPNFNEYSMQTAVQVARKLELRKKSAASYPVQTNQLYVMGISNAFGLEAWNSYTNAYPRRLQVNAWVQFTTALTNRLTGKVVGSPLTLNLGTNFFVPKNTWVGKQFQLPLNTNIVILTNMAYRSDRSVFVPFNDTTVFENVPNFAMPDLTLSVRARMQFWLIDTEVSPQRVVDFVNLAQLGSDMDLTSELVGNQNLLEGASGTGSFWQTNVYKASGVPWGVRAQIDEALGQGTNGASIWVDFNSSPAAGGTRDKAIDLFRVFVGLTPIKGYSKTDMQQELGMSLTHQVPFSPVRKFYKNDSYQVNDPLVHYMVEDLIDIQRTNNIQYAVPPTAVPTNSNLGMLNRRYAPWGGNPNVSSDRFAKDMSVKDPMVQRSDDWNFPTNQFPNIGWLGRVHRGTPWQTVYLKSAVVATQEWARMSGFLKASQVSPQDVFRLPTGNLNYFTHPTNDWRILDLFTTAINENASRGRLSVNQTNTAAWSAVLSGVSVLTNAHTAAASGPSTNVTEMFIEPNSVQLRAIVDSINKTRLEKPGQMYRYLGEVLSAPGLSTNSPYLSGVNNPNYSDEVVERIPQQVLSLLKSDEPRVTVYTFGQTLIPAANSRLLAGPNRGMCTNYQVVGEVVAKQVLRIDGTVVRPAAVRERFQYLPND